MKLRVSQADRSKISQLMGSKARLEPVISHWFDSISDH